jgi:hypothetical protein
VRALFDCKLHSSQAARRHARGRRAHAPEEEVVGVGRERAVLKQSQEVVVLSVHVAADLDGRLQLQQYRLLHEHLAALDAQAANLGLRLRTASATPKISDREQLAHTSGRSTAGQQRPQRDAAQRVPTAHQIHLLPRSRAPDIEQLVDDCVHCTTQIETRVRRRRECSARDPYARAHARSTQPNVRTPPDAAAPRAKKKARRTHARLVHTKHAKTARSAPWDAVRTVKLARHASQTVRAMRCKPPHKGAKGGLC